MKRALWVLLALGLLLGGLWLAGRAPTRYVLERECRRMLDERKAAEARLQLQLAREQKRGEDGAATKARIEALYREPERLDVRGWQVVLVPPGGVRPDPAGYYDLGRVDASRDGDPALLRGPVLVWARADGGLAGLLVRLRLAP